MEEIYKEKDLIFQGINELADVVTMTLGPLGSTIGFTDNYGNSFVTKDGVTVAINTKFKNPIKNMAANMIKEAAQNTVKQAGDGTTTSIALARAFIIEGAKLNLPPRQMIEELEKLEQEVIEFLFKESKDIKEDQIKDVALVSCNGDEKMANIITEAYQHSSIVQIEEGTTPEDKLEVIDGMRLDGTLFDIAFINDIPRQAISYDKCKFIIVQGKVRDINQLAPYITGEQAYPIVIMADHFPDEVVNILKREYNKGSIAVGLIKSPSFATNRKTLVEDIINYTSAKKGNTADVYYTNVDKVFANTEHITIAKEGAKVDYLEDLIKAYDESKESASKELLAKRIVYLSGKLSIVYPGGKSELERKERADRMEDAVLAVKCALEEGIIKGGGFPLFELSQKTKNKFAPCLSVPRYHLSEVVVTDNIIDPVKVTRCAVINAISVAKSIISMGAVVINERLWT